MGQVVQILVILFILSGLRSSAQDIMTVRKLKLPGKLVEFRDGQAVFITNSGVTFVVDHDYKMFINKHDNNDSTVTPTPFDGSISEFYVNARTARDKGIVGQIDLSMLLSKFGNGPTPSVSGTIGYKFWPYLNAGVGAGFEKYDQKVLKPVFLRLSGVVADQYVAPYYDVSGGYSFAKSSAKARWDGELDPRAKGGFRFYPQVGFIFQDRISTFIAFGYLTQRVTTTSGFIDWQGNPSKTTISRALNIYTLRLGFTF